jgi:transcription elongation GreA/GreB family factor
MSRAFMKEREDVLPPDASLLQRNAPHYVTAAGRRRLEERLAAEADPRERRRLERSLEHAVVVMPPADRSVAAFGATVAVRDGSNQPQRYSIVGEDEVDIPAGRVGVDSPLAQALLGARAGDTVVWHRPAGDRPLRVEAVTYD